MKNKYRNLSKGPWFIVIVFLIAGALLLLRVRAKQMEQAGVFNPTPLRVTTATVVSGNIKETRQYLATIEPVSAAEIASQVTARINEVFADIGNEVSSGEILAVLDGSEVEHNLKATRSRILEAGAEIEGTRMRRYSLEKNSAYWREEARRADFLFSEGAIARSEAEMASLKKEEAEATLKETESRIRALKERQSSLSSEAAALKERLKNFSVSSPFTGTVTARMAEPGNLARNGEILFTIEDRSGWRVKFKVPQEDLGLIRVGQPISGSFGQISLKGQVDRVSPSVDAARMGHAEATLEVDPEDPANLMFGRGVSLTIDVTLKSHEKTILVPLEGIIRTGEKPFVYIVYGGKLKKQEVLVVASDGERAAIKGVSVGDRVVLNSPFGWATLSEGREVVEE